MHSLEKSEKTLNNLVGLNAGRIKFFIILI